METKYESYVVQDTKEEVPGVVTLFLSYVDKSTPDYLPGQYINIFFPESETQEGKAYSISSAPHEDFFSITVRGIGEFSNKLIKLKPGDVLDASLPYGFFGAESDDTDLVMLAAGIGVTPLRGIIRHEAKQGFKRPVTLFHSIRTLSDAIFNKEFSDYAHNHANFTLNQFITREDIPGLTQAKFGRIDMPKIFQEFTPSESMEFLICGSIPFTRDMWRGLIENGVSEDYIYTEAFFSH